MTNWWTFITNASIPVKLVIVLLVSSSIIGWGYILQHRKLIRAMHKASTRFDQLFRSNIDLHKLFTEQQEKAGKLIGAEAIFFAGFKELTELQQNTNSSLQTDALIESVQRAMRIAHAREMAKLEQPLNYLATTGSTSPYIGLFGTVWGIMTAFQSLGKVQQATIGMVAPGISEALITTALGLLAAIPAVIAYNRFTNQAEQLNNQFATFQEEFSGLLLREAYIYNKKQ